MSQAALERHEIDSYEASGRKALFVLSKIAMRRWIHGTKTTLQDLLKEIDGSKALKHFKSAYDDPTRDFELSDYFGKAEKTNFTSRGKAYELFADFVLEEIERLPPGYSPDFILPGLESLRAKNRTASISFKEFAGLLSQDSLPQLICSSGGEVRHPKLKWRSIRKPESYDVPAYSEASLKLLLCGFSEEFRKGEPEARVLYVIREPRGVFAEQEQADKLATLVRDVLWIRKTSTDTTRRFRRANAEAEHLGYYFGGSSGDVYAITQADVVSDGQVHLYGQELRNDGKNGELSASHFALMMPALSDADGALLRRGLISGATKNQAKRPAAGKIAILDPKESDDLAINLETIVSQTMLLKRVQGTLQRVSGRAECAFAALDYLQANGRIGILASHKLAKRSADELGRLLALRRSFKSLVAPDTAPVVDDVTTKMFFDLLQPAVKAQIEAARQTPFREDLEEILQGILNNWGMLESLSIFQPVGIAESELKREEKEMITELLGATTVVADAINA